VSSTNEGLESRPFGRSTVYGTCCSTWPPASRSVETTVGRSTWLGGDVSGLHQSARFANPSCLHPNSCCITYAVNVNTSCSPPDKRTCHRSHKYLGEESVPNGAKPDVTASHTSWQSLQPWSMLFSFHFSSSRNWDRSVGIATGYGLDGPGSIPGNARFFSSPQRPDRLWHPASLLSNGYRGLSSWR
jgi:hypothetical protein